MGAALHSHGSRFFGVALFGASVVQAVVGLIGLLAGVPARWRRIGYAFAAITALAVPVSVMIEIAR